jgi:hypothetical protein
MDASIHAPDAAHAAAWGVVAAVQLALHVALVGVVAGAVVPHSALRPLGLVRWLLPEFWRRVACVGYHAGLGCVLLLASAWPSVEAVLAVRAQGDDMAPQLDEWLCQRDAISHVYGNPTLVRAQGSLLVILFLLQFAERVAHAVVGVRPVPLGLRVARAFGVGGLWWATASAAPLSIPLGCALAVNAALDHLAEACALARGPDFAWYCDLARAVCEFFGGIGLVLASTVVLDCGAGRRASAISALVGFGHTLPLCFSILRWSAAQMFIDSERLQDDES